MKLFKNIEARVSYFCIRNKNLIIVDEHNKIYYIDENLKIIDFYEIPLKYNKPDEKSVRISNSATFLLIGIKNILFLWDLEKKSLIKEFIEQKQDILSVNFSKDDKYFAFSSIGGDVYVYNTELQKLVLKLPKHKDFITDIEFDETGNFLYAGGFDKAVIFYNLMNISKKERYLHLKSVEKIEYKNFLISSDKLSFTVLWREDNEDYKDIIKLYKEFKDFFIDNDFLLIANKDNILIYNLKELVIENSDFLKTDDIDKIAVFNNYFFISKSNGEIYYKDLFEEKDEFLNAVLKEDFVKAYEYLNKNPYLKSSKEYEKLDYMIDLTIQRAKELFEEDEAQALKVLDKLMAVGELREKSETVIENFRNIKRLKFALNRNDYVLAYKIIEEYPLLKETKYYQDLENKFNAVYEKAVEFISENEIERAKIILKPFMDIPSKMIYIESIFSNPEFVLKLKRAKEEKNFKEFFEIINLNPALKNTKEYKEVMEYGEFLYKFIKKFIKEEKFDKAKKALDILKNIEGYEIKAKELSEVVENSLKFLEFIKNEDLKNALKMTKKYTYLQDLKEYNELKTKFNQILSKAEKYALNKDYLKAKKVLTSANIQDTKRGKHILMMKEKED